MCEGFELYVFSYLIFYMVTPALILENIIIRYFFILIDFSKNILEHSGPKISVGMWFYFSTKWSFLFQNHIMSMRASMMSTSIMKKWLWALFSKNTDGDSRNMHSTYSNEFLFLLKFLFFIILSDCFFLELLPLTSLGILLVFSLSQWGLKHFWLHFIS